MGENYIRRLSVLKLNDFIIHFHGWSKQGINRERGTFTIIAASKKKKFSFKTMVIACVT